MSSKFNVEKITRNSIFVTWRNIRCSEHSSDQNSPSFTLATNGWLVNFSLSITGTKDCSLTVNKNSSGTGKGIVSLAVTGGTGGNTVKMYLNEKWEKSCLFKNIATLSSTSWTYLEIGCKITWLGFIDDDTNPKHPLFLQSIENVPFDNTVLSDFTIVVEGQEIPSHKVILARFSPVLLAMFESPMKESEENRMIIEDFEYSTIKALLKIIYGGKTEDLDDIDTAFKVFQAAEKYQISMVKHLCEDKLQRKIQKDNVLMLLDKADEYGATELRESCIMYIFAAKNPKITSEFERISQKPSIALAVANAFMSQLLLTPEK